MEWASHRRQMWEWNCLLTKGHCLYLPQNMVVSSQQVEKYLGSTCTTTARHSLLWGCRKQFFGDTTARCANEGLEIHSSTSYGIVLSPHSKLEGTWFILFLWPLHPALQKSFLLKISWRLEYFWGKKMFCFLTFKWNETRNLINSSCLAVMYEHKDKAKISIKSHHVLRGLEFVHSINGKKKNILFLKVQGGVFGFFFQFFCPWILNINTHRPLKASLDCSEPLAQGLPAEVTLGGSPRKGEHQLKYTNNKRQGLRLPCLANCPSPSGVLLNHQAWPTRSLDSCPIVWFPHQQSSEVLAALVQVLLPRRSQCIWNDNECFE